MAAAVIITRIHVGDYESWRPMFDQDLPRAREKATSQRVLQDAADSGHVFIVLEFASLDDAKESKQRLLDAGVLDRFADRHGPNVLVEA